MSAWIVHQPRVPESPAVRPAVLIVDDNAQNLDLLATWVGGLPVNVTVANDGIEALERVRDRQPDLIVLDVMMPRMSGFEVCRRLKADVSTRAIAVLMVTALREPEDMDAARQAGADAFLSKPVRRMEFLQQIRMLLGNAGG